MAFVHLVRCFCAYEVYFLLWTMHCIESGDIKVDRAMCIRVTFEVVGAFFAYYFVKHSIEISS